MEFVVPPDTQPQRADKLLSELLTRAFSRSQIARMIRSGEVLVQGHKIKPSTILMAGDKIDITPSEPEWHVTDQEPLSLSPNIIFEDCHLFVIEKPPGLVVHPGGGRTSGTLVDILVCQHPEIRGVGEPGRWGVVHRLDKDTSGLMIVAKTQQAHNMLSQQFKQHSVQKVYHALVRGSPRKDAGTISVPIGRHVKDRKRMSIAASKSRPAVTRWNIAERLGYLTLLEIRPDTGRTHQIRVHLASIGLPILGDSVYGRLRQNLRNIPPIVRKCTALLRRQALHASRLGIYHPANGEYLEFVSPLPQDIETIITLLRCDSISPQ